MPTLRCQRPPLHDHQEAIHRFREIYAAVRAEIGKVMVGQDAIVDGTLTAILGGGHGVRLEVADKAAGTKSPLL